MGIHLDFLERSPQGTSIGIVYAQGRMGYLLLHALEVFRVFWVTRFTYRLRIE